MSPFIYAINYLKLLLKMAQKRKGDTLRPKATGKMDNDKERGCEACAGLCQIGAV